MPYISIILLAKILFVEVAFIVTEVIGDVFLHFPELIAILSDILVAVDPP
jgi:hypothetical protein